MLNNLSNFWNIITGKMIKKIAEPSDLIPLGTRDSRYGGNYKPTAISFEDLLIQITPEPTYKVFTALLTQSGGDDPQDGNGFTLTIGVTYEILENSGGADFTIVGAPNNDVGTKFIATGTNPNWGNAVADLGYNTGAPVATVLENTIGNIWFTYQNTGIYRADYINGFTVDKTVVFSNPSSVNGDNVIETDLTSPSAYFLSYSLSTNTYENDLLYKTPIEIRVYN